MSAILPPSERLWWKHPLDRVEGTWIAIALVWCLTMFAMMVGWHLYGKQNLSTETYRTTPEKFSAKAQAVVDKYTVRTKTYKLHLTSMDYNHGFSLQPANINIQIVPGYEHVVTVTPNQSGTYSVVCNEFCGINHHTMVGRIYVK
jgi:cytochrome c oxidase subunit 2